MNIVITGTTGFVGTNLKVSLHAKGYQIVEVNRKSKVDGFFSFEDAFSGKCKGNVWIHLAGKSKDVQHQKMIDEYLEANVELTKKVYTAFIADVTASTFIFISSVKAAASRIENKLIEEDIFEVDVPYGSTKRAAEDYLLSIILPKGKKLIILRPSMIYGPNTDSNLYSLYSYVKRGLPYPFAAFNNMRTMLSINNLTHVIAHIVSDDNFSPGIYNVADDDAISTNELIELMSRSLGKQPSLWCIPKKIIKYIGVFGDIFHLPVNTKKINKLTEDYTVSNEKLLKEMGKTLPYSTREELNRLFKVFKIRKMQGSTSRGFM